MKKQKDRTYTNDRINVALGFGAELPYGFHVYAEPSVLFTNYKGERWTVKDYQFEEIKERDVTQRYSISISNRNIAVWGLVPTLTYSYTDKSSNIWQREYEKIFWLNFLSKSVFKIIFYITHDFFSEKPRS